jgi:hypothetical protein
MKPERIRMTWLFLFAGLILIFSSCHPRQVSDIKPNMTKEEVVALWGGTPLVTHKTVNGKPIETWEYHFATTDSICLVTFAQERVVKTECRQQPRTYNYYANPYYPYYPYPYYYFPYPYYYPYRYYYPYPYSYPYPYRRYWR